MLPHTCRSLCGSWRPRPFDPPLKAMLALPPSSLTPSSSPLNIALYPAGSVAQSFDDKKHVFSSRRWYCVSSLFTLKWRVLKSCLSL